MSEQRQQLSLFETSKTMHTERIDLSWTDDGFKRSMRLGADDILKETDIEDLKGGVRRVWDLMSDREWHSASEIRIAVGKNGAEASEGLRRLRELRQSIGIVVEKMKVEDRRLWIYRVIDQREEISG